MNTVGKILVILNFLFAILVGALLVMNAAIGNNWKAAYEAQLRETKVLVSGRDATANANVAVTGDYQRNKLELEAQRQKLNDEEETRKALVFGHKTKIADLEQQIADQAKTLAITKTAQDRQLEEINNLTKTIRDREKLIAKYEGDIKMERVRARDFEAKFTAATARNESLLEQLRLATLAQAKDKAGVNTGRVMVKNPNEPNPPPVAVKGKVEKVEGDLVQISLGTDHSVNKDNTLDIYRLKPAPQYLGMIRIVDANNHTSVGRLIPSGNAAFRPVLREGDVVSSKLP
jgi:hypothetical protein